MRAPIVIVLASLVLAACGGTTHKTVVVNAPENSTTVVTPNGDTHVVTHDHD